MGLTPGSYEAYCLDQAVWYLGTSITNRLENIGRKKQRGEAGMQAARERELTLILEGKDAKGSYADPSLLFS